MSCGLFYWRQLMNLDFNKLNGLVTAVIQDHKTGRVLMVGFMNDEAFARRSKQDASHFSAVPATSSG